MTEADNKFLAEKMGIPFHIWKGSGGRWFCTCGCGTMLYTFNRPPKTKYDFTSTSGFCLALAWAQGDGKHPGWRWVDFDWHARWKHLHQLAETIGTDETKSSSYTRWLFTPANFAPVLVEFLRKEDGE